MEEDVCAQEQLVYPSRRSLLAGAAAAGFLLAAPLSDEAFATSALPKTRLHDLEPNKQGTLVVNRPVLVARSQSALEIVITARGRLVFHPRRSVTLKVRRNLIVQGKLLMAPTAARFRHTVKFHRVHEQQFVGGGMGVLPTDPGLWVVDRGKLELRGTPKTAWVRSAHSLAAGSLTIKLAVPPVGWRAGDALVVTPTLPPTRAGFEIAYDSIRIRSVQGDVVHLSAPLRHAHPTMTSGRLAVAPQVLNLTRNVRIQGRPHQRSHVFIHASRRQQIRYVELTHLGPRQKNGQYTSPVLGRYALHFHMMGGASRGSDVTGACAHACGSHAFVPHSSDGITFTSCIAYDVFEEAYWWDGPATTRSDAPRTNDVAYQACVASRVRTDPPFRGYRLTGFWLGAGRGSRITQCTASGVQGNLDSSGFLWPEGSSGVWDFSNCVAHNNTRHGIFVWQNDTDAHVIDRFAAIRNGGSGISHGAYLNGFAYQDLWLVGNSEGGVKLAASSSKNRRVRIRRVSIDGEHSNEPAMTLSHHNLAARGATVIQDVRASSYAGAFLRLDEASTHSGHGFPSDVVLNRIHHDAAVPAIQVVSTYPGSLVRWRHPSGETVVTGGVITGPDPVPDPAAVPAARVAVARSSPT
jgi:hypothetical protein